MQSPTVQRSWLPLRVHFRSTVQQRGCESLDACESYPNERMCWRQRDQSDLNTILFEPQRGGGESSPAERPIPSGNKPAIHPERVAVLSCRCQRLFNFEKVVHAVLQSQCSQQGKLVCLCSNCDDGETLNSKGSSWEPAFLPWQMGRTASPSRLHVDRPHLPSKSGLRPTCRRSLGPLVRHCDFPTPPCANTG